MTPDERKAAIAAYKERKPASGITAKARSEVDYLLSRVARVDRRAAMQPQSSAAG